MFEVKVNRGQMACLISLVYQNAHEEETEEARELYHAVMAAAEKGMVKNV